MYALALATIMSVSEPRPINTLLSFSIRIVTSPRASIPSVTASTRYSVSVFGTWTIRLMAL